VVLITRTHNPGAGLLALPSGFIDAVNGRVERPLIAAMREAVEETGIKKVFLKGRVLIPQNPGGTTVPSISARRGISPF
jgi:ADP-ribose pyrophosphatase YjhB (NUDIX family)